MKRYKVIKVICVACLAFTVSTVCNIPSNLQEIKVYALSTDKIKTMETFEEVLKEELEQRNPLIEVEYKGKADTITQETLDTMINNIMKDLYLKNSIDTWSYEVSGYSGNFKVTFNVSYRTSHEEEFEVNRLVHSILGSIITNDMNTFEKVKSINDYIVLNSKYSLNTVGTPYSPYTLLNEGMGVCSAYALLAHRMLETAGIESYIVEGETTELHAWNLVRIGDNYYHLDTTWNDPLEDREGLVQYTYFLVSDEVMSKDHTWDKTLYPKAADNSYKWIQELRETYSKGNTIYYVSADGKEKSITYNTYKDKEVENLSREIEENTEPSTLQISATDSSNADINNSILDTIMNFVVNLVKKIK